MRADGRPSVALAVLAGRLPDSSPALQVLAEERTEIIEAIERAGFWLMRSGASLFLLNMQDETQDDEQAGVEAEMLTALRMVIREFANFEMCGSERRAMDAAVKAVLRASGSAA